MKNIVVVEDQPKWREQILSHLKQYEKEKGVAFDVVFHNDGESFLSSLGKEEGNEPDILFMDIGLPGINGIDVCKKVREVNADVCIVFLTEFAQFAIQGYEVNAYDYLVKPLQYSLFSIKMDRYIAHLKKSGKSFTMVKDGGQTYHVEHADLLYVESQKHYIYFHTAAKVYRMRGYLDEFSDNLLLQGFSKINRSILVNLSKIENFTNSDVRVGGELLPLSRVYKSNFLHDLNLFMGRGR